MGLLDLGPATEPLVVSAEIWSTVFPVVVEGGDIDNRAGEGHIAGQPVTVDLPGHRTVRFFVVGYLYVLATEFDVVTEWTDRGATLTPRVGPGGYWLESSGHGYDRDWANLMAVSATLLEPDDDGGDTASHVESVLVVPDGAGAGVVLVDVQARTIQRLSLPAGTWRIRGSPDGLRAVPADAGQAGDR